jgi:hypothetical protein
MRIYTNPLVNKKLWQYIADVDTEVGGFGYASLTEDGDFIWDDVFLVPQVVSSSEVEFDGDGITKAIERAIKDERLGKPGFTWVSWHSHHSMGAFWSGTDEDCIKTYGEAGIPMLLSFVGNKNGEYKMRFDAFDVQHSGVTISQVTMSDLKMLDDGTDEVINAVRKEIADNVTKAKPPATTSGWTKGRPLNGGKLPQPIDKRPSQSLTERELGVTINEAFEIKELMDKDGLTYADAFEKVCGEDYSRFLVGPSGVIDRFDTMLGEGA